jgi:PAS domain S-box-containing protein
MANAFASKKHRAFFALFRGVLEAAPDPTLVVDLDGNIIFANAVTEKVLRWPQKELIGYGVEKLIPHHLHEAHTALRARYNNEPSMRAMGAGRELVAIRGDGVPLPVEISLNPIPADDGMRVVCVLRDITERKRVSERTLQFQSANQELEMLAYSIAHDLRAPLRAILGFSARLNSELTASSGEALRCLGIVSSRASQIATMIDDYLRLLRIRVYELAPESIDSEVLVRDVSNALALYNAECLTIGAMPTVNADRALLHELWTQLLSNAAKFGAKVTPSRIHAAGYEDDRFVYFSLRDNGVGFDPDYAGKLFRVFERLHTARDYPGNGIGLCLAKRIVERHGGGIAIDGKINEGATVTFWLPK